MKYLAYITRTYKRFACRIGWHAPLAKLRLGGFDGCSAHAECPWCGFRGMLDSQGNLF